MPCQDISVYRVMVRRRLRLNHATRDKATPSHHCDALMRFKLLLKATFQQSCGAHSHPRLQEEAVITVALIHLTLPSRDHFWLIYTFQSNLPLGTAKADVPMDIQEWHITNRKCRDSGVQGQFNRSSLLREMTVLASLNKDVPPPACFDWRGWFRAGLPFFRENMILRLVP
ncbi:hypothetical protein J6590_016599 [Homalodisca vitripennis]|nr:hypothetical protein J6590_016599 [Homalodisca vitripennis]